MCITDNVLTTYVNGPDGVMAGTSIYDAMLPHITNHLPTFETDPVIASAMRQACHRNLYAVANSCGMNGVGADTVVKATRPVILTIMMILVCAFALLLVVMAALWIRGSRKLRKTDEYQAYQAFKKAGSSQTAQTG